jgi:hypothetical protein
VIAEQRAKQDCCTKCWSQYGIPDGNIDEHMKAKSTASLETAELDKVRGVLKNSFDGRTR